VLPAPQQSHAGEILRIRIEVQDTGPGLSKEQKRQIFEPFYQAGGSLNQQHSGTGLGTTIAANLIKLMHGEIGVESEPGKGCTFWVEIPCRYEMPTRLDTTQLSQAHPLVIFELHKTHVAILEKYCRGLHWPYAIFSQQDALISKLKQDVAEGLKPVALLSELACAEHCGQLASKLHSLFGDKITLCTK
jgi:hypothetical protein